MINVAVRERMSLSVGDSDRCQWYFKFEDAEGDIIGQWRESSEEITGRGH